MAKQTECPSCLAQVTKVVTTRYTKKMRLVKRYCYCVACGNNFITVEIGLTQYQELQAADSLLNTVLETLLSTSGRQTLLRLPVFKRLTSIVKEKEK